MDAARRAAAEEVIRLPLAIAALALSSQALCAESLDCSSPFAPSGQIAEADQRIAPGRVQTGTLNIVDYKIYCSDGSGTFESSDGQTRTTWNVSCKKDAMSDKVWCRAQARDLRIIATRSGQLFVGVGSDHFPRSSVAIRVDSAQPVVSTADGDGFFRDNASAQLIKRMRTAKSITTRYMEWPNRYWTDDSFPPLGLNEVLQYLTWAVRRIR